MKYFFFFIATAVIFFACKSKTQTTETESVQTSNTLYENIKTGGIKMIPIDGKYQVWTKKIGDGPIKLLLLHGGPGFTHDYFECFEDFLPNEGVTIYYYDQLGAGNSEHPTDTSLWNIARYVEEVEQVRKGLGLENFYLLGHSWGSMLAMEYLQKYQQHVKAAILSNMTAGVKSYVTYSNQQKNEFLTKEELRVFDSLDKKGLYESPDYQNLLMNKLYTRNICRMPLDKWPEPIMRAFSKANHTIYTQMQGVDEFHVTGNFKNWEMWDRLPNIKVPTLVIGGIYDEMNPVDMKKEGQLIPNSRTYLCPNGAHLSMYDDQANYFNNLIKFIKDVHKNQFVADKK